MERALLEAMSWVIPECPAGVLDELRRIVGPEDPFWSEVAKLDASDLADLANAVAQRWVVLVRDAYFAHPVALAEIGFRM